MRIHGGVREARIDFSVNTNPIGPPEKIHRILENCLKRRVYEKYPDYNQAMTRRLIAEFYGVDEANLILSNGAAEAINLVIIAAKPRRIVVAEPSYGEYESIVGVLNIRYEYVLMKIREERFLLDLGELRSFCEEDTLIVITNPNNPTGSYVDRGEIIDFGRECGAKILLDEAYIELCDKCPIHVGDASENIIVVRTLTKWLAIPGLRIGFIHTVDHGLLNRIDLLRQPWNINSLAECLVEELFLDKRDLLEFIEASRKYIYSERRRVRDLLKRIGLRVFESDTNILLIENPYSQMIIRELLRRGVAVRDCSSFKGLGPSYFRIGVKRRDENDLLIKYLSEEIRYR